MMIESAGYARNSDGNSGSVKGDYELTENWKNGVRRPTESVAYAVAECDNVTILTSTLVHKVIFNASNTRAIAVDMSKGMFYEGDRPLCRCLSLPATPPLWRRPWQPTIFRSSAISLPSGRLCTIIFVLGAERTGQRDGRGP